MLFWDSARRQALSLHLRDAVDVLRSIGDAAVFGSEVRDVLPLLPRRPEPDEAALAHWLAGAGPPRGRTLYAGVHRSARWTLPPVLGKWMRESAWWRPRYSRPIGSRPARNLVETLLHLLEQSVRRRLTADGKTGVMLSGGLDSAAVAGVATVVARRPRGSCILGRFSDHPTVDEANLIDRLGDTPPTQDVRIEADVGPLLDRRSTTSTRGSCRPARRTCSSGCPSCSAPPPTAYG